MRPPLRSRTNQRGIAGFVAIVAALHSIAPSLAFAQGAVQPPFVSPDGLTVDQLVTRAVSTEPGLRAARQGVEAARARITQASLRPNPVFSATRQDEVGGTDNQTMTSLEWPLDLARRGARVAAATAAATVAEHEASERVRQLAADVRSAAGALLAAERQMRVATELVDTMRRLARLVGARADEGAVPRLEHDLTLVEVHRLGVQQALTESRARQAAVMLTSVIGLPITAPVVLRVSLEDEAGGRAAGADTVAAAVTNRPDVKAAEARAELAEARTELARREGRLDAAIFGSYQRMDAGFPQRGFDETGVLMRVRGVFHNVAGGVRLTLPWRNRNQGESRAIEAERAAAVAERERTELTATAEVAAAQIGEAAAAQAVTAYQQQVRDVAAKNLAVMRESFELGRTSLNDVLVEQRRFLEIEAELTDLLLQRYQVRVALRLALGLVP